MVESVHRPLAVYRYRLTMVDALAYERLPGEWSGWQKAALILPLIAIGVLAGFFEDELGVWWWVSVAALLVLWAAVGLVISNWRVHSRARARAVHEGQIEVEEWDDRLVVRSQAGQTSLPFGMIGRVIVTDSHVFILWRGGSLILPLRAFDDLGAMRNFGETIDRRCAEAEL